MWSSFYFLISLFSHFPPPCLHKYIWALASSILIVIINAMKICSKCVFYLYLHLFLKYNCMVKVIQTRARLIYRRADIIRWYQAFSKQLVSAFIMADKLIFKIQNKNRWNTLQPCSECWRCVVCPPEGALQRPCWQRLLDFCCRYCVLFKGL